MESSRGNISIIHSFTTMVIGISPLPLIISVFLVWVLIIMMRGDSSVGVVSCEKASHTTTALRTFIDGSMIREMLSSRGIAIRLEDA